MFAHCDTCRRVATLAIGDGLTTDSRPWLSPAVASRLVHRSATQKFGAELCRKLPRHRQGSIALWAEMFNPEGRICLSAADSMNHISGIFAETAALTL